MYYFWTLLEALKRRTYVGSNNTWAININKKVGEATYHVFILSSWPYLFITAVNDFK